MQENQAAEDHPEGTGYLPVFLRWRDLPETRSLQKRAILSWIGIVIIVALIAADYFSLTFNVFSDYNFLTLLLGIAVAGLAFYATTRKHRIDEILTETYRSNLMKNVETKYGTDEMTYAGQIILHAKGEDVYEYAYTVDEDTGEPELLFTVKRTVGQIQQRFDREKREAEAKKAKRKSGKKKKS